MKIEKTECSYQVTEYDLKFGEQITLDGKLLILVSVLDKIRAELIQSIQNGTLKIENGNEELFRIIDKYIAETKDNEQEEERDM